MVAPGLVVWVVLTSQIVAGFDFGRELLKENLHEDQAKHVINKSPSELLRMRGFESEVHKVHTPDGYFIHVVRVINPKARLLQLKRPVVFNHGLLESATIWLINARGVEAQPIESLCNKLDQQQRNISASCLNGPMMLANNGYDVWLMSLRGTDYSLGHDFLLNNDKQFWDYSLDNFALVDVPSVIDYVRHTTHCDKVGYVGHSQATFSIFGLLASRPHYADIVEPVIAVAPVAYFNTNISPLAKVLFMAKELGDKKEQGRWPRKAPLYRESFAKLCDIKNPKRKMRVCRMVEMLVGGKGKPWLTGYYSHLPYYTSFKVLRHFGQLILHKKYSMYDYGSEENLNYYGNKTAPEYPICNIRSTSLCLFSTKSDALSTPADVEHFRRELKVTLHKDIFINRNYNHFDLITHEDSGQLVFEPMLDVFEEFEYGSGICSPNTSR